MTDRETRPSVLLVDFDDQCRKIAGRALRDTGYRVIEARTSAFAVALMDSAASVAAPVDLVVVDPGISGMGIEEIGRRIRACQPDLKILYVTRSVDKLFEARGALWTGEAYLAKPFTTKGLVEAVSLLLYGCLNRDDVAALGSGRRLNGGAGANWRWRPSRSRPQPLTIAGSWRGRSHHLVLVSSRAD